MDMKAFSSFVFIIVTVILVDNHFHS